MKKIVYSLLLFLSVSCSSAATQSAPTPEKKVETASQEKVAQNQSKGFVTHVVQWREDVRWLFINLDLVAFFLTLIIYMRGSREGSHDISGLLLIIFGVSIVVTCIVAALSTCLYFIIEEKEVKEEDKRLTFTKHFLAKWIPLLPAIAFATLLLFLFLKKKENNNKKVLGSIFNLCVNASTCLMAAPAPYLTSYLKLGSDDTIKPQKTTQKFSFLKRWISYSGSMVTYFVIIQTGVLLVELITKKKWFQCLLFFIIMAIVMASNTMISYTFEKEKMPSEQKTFGHHFFRSSVPMLFAFFTFLFSFRISGDSFQASKNNNGMRDEREQKVILIAYILYKLICCVIIAPILVVIERYMVTKKSTQRDSSKKSRKEA